MERRNSDSIQPYLPIPAGSLDAPWWSSYVLAGPSHTAALLQETEGGSMKRRTNIVAVASLVFGLVFGLAPAAGAHVPWDVHDVCDLEGNLYFYPGGPSRWWFIHSGAPGATEGCHLYTSNAQTQTYNYADWYLPTQSCDRALPSTGGHNDGRCYNEKKYTGTYQVLVYLVRESHFTTKRAPYVRYAFNLARGPTSKHIIDQSIAPTANKFVLSGWLDTRVDDGNSGFMRLNDYTGEASQTKWVGVDRLYYHPVD
jgi:hypothetical protein